MKQNVSMVSVAGRLGISVSEVSRAFKPGYPMNPDKRAMIIETAEEMGYVRNEAASRLSRRALTIGIIYENANPEFDREILRGFQSAERIYSAYKLICRYFCGVDNAGELDAALAELADSGCDGVVLQVYFDGIGEVIEKYSGRMKIALVNYDLPDCGRLFASVNNTGVVAKIAAQLLGQFSKPGRTVVFAGVESHWAHQRIVGSFRDEAAAAGLTIAAVLHAADDREMYDQLDIFEKFPDITSVYATSAVSVPICEYIAERGLADRVTVVASDVYERLARYIEDGVVLATLYQNPVWQAYHALECMYHSIADGRQPPELMVAKPEIVMKSNLSLYLNEAEV